MNGLKILSVAILSMVFAGACGVDTEQSSKQTDVAVLSQNIVELYEDGQAGRIAETQVDLTLFDGEVIFERQAHSRR